jgi:hypothetical protein
LSKHAHVRLSIGDLVAEGSDLSRAAWRDAWAPMLLVIAGHTLVFMNQHVAASDWHAGIWTFIGPALLIFYIPLYGALYRAALGGRTIESHGPAGLQWNGVEWRLITVGVIIVFLAGLAMTPFLAVTGIAALIMRGTPFTISYLGTWARWAPGAAIIWAFFFWIMAPRLARLMLGWPYSTGREKTEPFAGWSPAERSGWSIAWAMVGACIPLALGYLGVFAMTLIEGDMLVGNYWPLPEAVGAGLLLGALKAAVTAPLLVGILSGAYWLLEEDRLAEEAAHPTPEHHGLLDSLGDAAKAATAAAAAALAAREAGVFGHHEADGHAPDAEPPHPEAEVEPPEPEAPSRHQSFLDSLGPAAKAALAAAAALAAKEAAELGLPPSEVDRHAADHYPPEPEPAPEPPAPEPPTPEPEVEPPHADAHVEPPAAAEQEMRMEAYDAPVNAPHTTPDHLEGPLSIWPHSILPPWPKPVAAAVAPKPVTTPLASAAEPAHASPEIAE